MCTHVRELRVFRGLPVRRCRVLLVALAADAVLGDPPNAWHPVVLLGRWIRVGERLAPAGRAARLGWGAAWLTGGAFIAGTAMRLLPRSELLVGLAASTLLAYRGLDRAVGEVQAALEADNLDEARRLLSWHLVSRPTGELSADEVAAAAIESLAENLSDSLVAPMLAYLAGGLPALAIYRLVNTADAMWGYRTERYEELGKVAARLDDAFNLLPARLTAALIILVQFTPMSPAIPSSVSLCPGAEAAFLCAGQRQGSAQERRARAAWRVAWRDARRTASPNAGWPMAAMAGALDTVLTKRDHYTLGDGKRRPDAAMVAEARVIARRVILLLVSVLGAGALAGAASRQEFQP